MLVWQWTCVLVCWGQRGRVGYHRHRPVVKSWKKLHLLTRSSSTAKAARISAAQRWSSCARLQIPDALGFSPPPGRVCRALVAHPSWRKAIGTRARARMRPGDWRLQLILAYITFLQLYSFVCAQSKTLILSAFLIKTRALIHISKAKTCLRDCVQCALAAVLLLLECSQDTHGCGRHFYGRLGLLASLLPDGAAEATHPSHIQNGGYA